ncbi:hypothetical protein ROE7235_02891 [Roseibaca ekhonensis]|uniref:Glycosyl transferase CAP10 domain-containing protein n=1 Tax=Roseinatronobacter ekhonensis TaxID=254356 RepID=A0A3B0MBU1_9RHOB|nr:glycosyl transferase family 90 [Roseibaca ekhonensis]SUZ33123.1 hypothetical protein ROE7235_02891 [Roseibaca ekhonensis]
MANREKLFAAMLQHRFPAHWADMMFWDNGALAAQLQTTDHHNMFGYDPATEKVFLNDDIARGLVRTAQGWHPNTEGEEFLRAAQVLNDLSGLELPFLADMRDHRARSGLVADDGRFVPVFQYNRLPQNRGGVIWPLSTHYQRIGSGTYFGSGLHDPLPFAQKRDIVFWRGAPTGHDRNGTRAIFSLRAYAAGKLDRVSCAARLKQVPRFALLDSFQTQPGYDLAFAEKASLPSPGEFGYRVTPPMPRKKMLNARYQLVIQGHDCGSNLPWLLGTNCLILRQDMAWQVCYSAALEPWEHYVPIAEDFSDLPEKLAWARANPDACEAIIAKANSVADNLADHAFEDSLRRAVLDRYRAALDG